MKEQARGAEEADLELDGAGMREMAGLVLERLVSQIEGFGEQHAAGDWAKAWDGGPRPIPGMGVPHFEELLDEVLERAKASFFTPGPGYLAYIPGGGLFPAALASFLAAGINRFTGIRAAAPALVALEEEAIEWLREGLGFDPGVVGVLTPGGSIANFTAILCAREKLLGPELRKGVLYCSDQVHHSVTKSARAAGILEDRQRSVPTSAALAMRPELLAEAIAADRARGLLPFCVVSSAGTTNTGAIDPLPEISEICRREGLWHHIDGAYGGAFQLVEEGRARLPGILQGDSLTIDPHKGLFLPYGTGMLFVREREDLERPHKSSAVYLPEDPGAGVFDPSHFSLELSRPFRGLPLWMSLRYFGLDRFRAALAEKLRLAGWIREELDKEEGLEVLEGQLTVVAFKVRGGGGEELMEAVNRKGRVYLSSCRLKGEFVVRICVLSFRTREPHARMVVEDVREFLKG
ncbi:MAG TPA: aminotransferase class V-fold PLP-dependent enzyme [Planctomycetes bacterium]|nr:aminotransferase class V-fold PLP-dependent enzyme [Planctomycetota bacterium]